MKLNTFLLFVFLAFKYYLFSDLFSNDIPWFGIDSILKSAKLLFCFGLTVVHLILLTADIIKVKKYFPNNKLLLALVITDPFYSVSFYSLRTVLFAIVLELSFLLFSENRPIANKIILAISCVISPTVIYGLLDNSLLFIVLVYLLLTEKFYSHKQALITFAVGIVSAIVGYGFAYAIVRRKWIFPNWNVMYDTTFGNLFTKNIQFGKAFFVALAILELVFWINQFLTAKKMGALKKTKKGKKENCIWIFATGMPVCIIPFIYLADNFSFLTPTITLSFVACALMMNKIVPNKVNSLITNDSLISIVVAVALNSVITKEIFPNSEVLEIINSFAPM